MKYEAFKIYVDAQTVVALSQIVADALKLLVLPADVVRADLLQFQNELDARIQHFPLGIERAGNNWLEE